jgi:hypothetical protein
MKITKTRLKEIIKEEVAKILEGKKTNVSGVEAEKPIFPGNGPVKQPIEEEDLEETSAMGAEAVAGSSAGPMSPKRKPVKEQ